MRKYWPIQNYNFSGFYSDRFQGFGWFNYFDHSFDYFRWWLFKIAYFLSLFVIGYVFLRLTTYSLHSEIFRGFFEMLAVGLKFFIRGFYEFFISFNAIIEDNIQTVVTMRDIDKKSLRSIPDYQELPDSGETEYARMFEPSPEDFEDNYWIDSSAFDIWSYNLVDVPSFITEDTDQDKAQNTRSLFKSMKFKKVHKKDL